MDISFLTKNKKKIIIVIIIISIILIGQSLLNSTYSLFYHEDIASNADSYSTGLLSITADAAGDNISLENTLPISDTEGENTTAYTFTIKNIGNLDYKFNVKLLSTGDSTTTIDSQYIKIKVDDGSVTTLSSLSNSIIKKDITLSAGQSIDISIRVWLSINTPNAQIGKVFNSKIVTDGQAVYTNVNDKTYSNYTGFAKVIANQFSPNEEVTNNNVIYKYDTVNNLMEDVGYNIRYYGASPNNYIYFNCDDYSNQTDTTCEKWRIIGVFDGNIKIMRGSTIGSYSWDNKNKSTGAEADGGKNDWTTARLMKLLNPSNYYTIDSNDNGYGQSLYWNGESGTCFSGANNETTACDFTNIGLKNDTTKSAIADNIWYIRSYNNGELYPNQIYRNEVVDGTIFNETRSTTWIGKIGLISVSDYLFASDFKICNESVNQYSKNYSCSKNWIKDSFTNVGSGVSGWFITPGSFNSSSVNYTIVSIASFNKYVICYLTYFAKCFTIRYDDLISIPYIHSIILSVR